jgi:hypothetical protein
VIAVTKMACVNVVQCGGTELGLVLTSCPACGIALSEHGAADSIKDNGGGGRKKGSKAAIAQTGYCEQ